MKSKFQTIVDGAGGNGNSAAGRRRRDVSAFFGSWSAEEGSEFDKKVEDAFGKISFQQGGLSGDGVR